MIIKEEKKSLPVHRRVTVKVRTDQKKEVPHTWLACKPFFFFCKVSFVGLCQANVCANTGCHLQKEWLCDTSPALSRTYESLSVKS